MEPNVYVLCAVIATCNLVMAFRAGNSWQFYLGEVAGVTSVAVAYFLFKFIW